MDNLSLSRSPSAALSTAVEPKKIQNNADRDAGGNFEEQLNEQIESAENVNKSQKTTENQADSQQAVESENNQQTPEQVQSENALAEAQADIVEPVVAEADTQNLLLESGNTLPDAAITGAAVVVVTDENISVKRVVDGEGDIVKTRADNAAQTTSQIPLNQQKNTPLVNQQAAQVSADSTEVPAEKNIPVDAFKTVLNKQSQATVPMAEGRLNPASVVQQITAATQLQQVPAVTSSSALNLNSSSLPVDSASANPLNTLQSSISAHVQSSAWSQGLTEKLSIMLGSQMQRAEIKLNPANLGPMEIKLSLKDDQASVSFISQHLPVRDALDQAMPRLREMLEQQGFDLVNVDISHNSAQQQSNSDTSSSEQSASGSVEAQENTENELQHEVSISQGNITSAGGVSIFA